MPQAPLRALSLGADAGILELDLISHVQPAWDTLPARVEFPGFSGKPRYLLHDRDGALHGGGHHDRPYEHRRGPHRPVLVLRTPTWKASLGQFDASASIT